ncbi:putative beta-arrestin [Ditylenchus destructor]|uniref:Beta-arrestin n=1 Tax=Ditylenchus destructor TaxID=166010 RepID=A0AAD4N3U5_9BILA|nr:putative beta-arrestin [Ditylenchus destructor]
MADADEKKAGTRVFKKTSPNGKITTYLGKRDFLDRGDAVDLIDGMVLIDQDYISSEKKVTVQLLAAFRYGREDLDVLGLTFRKDLISQYFQVYPPPTEPTRALTRLQERLKKKLASSVTLQPAQGDTGKPCGVDYEIKTVVGSDSSSDKPKKHNSVRLAIRKLTYAPTVERPQPMVDVTKEFYISPGGLHLEASLDREMYHHGETISVNVHVQNNSNKTVKKIKVAVVQISDICIFTTASYSCDVDKVESYEGFPVGPGSTLSKIYTLCPLLSKNKDKRGLALDGQLKHEDTNLASSTPYALLTQSMRENLGIIVQYKVKIRLLIAGALGGELAAELPFTLTHPKPADTPPPEVKRSSSNVYTEVNPNRSEKPRESMTDVDLIHFDSFDEERTYEDDDIVFEDFARLRVRGATDADDNDKLIQT